MPTQGELVIWPIDERGKERIWSFNHESAAENMKDLEVRIASGGSVSIYRRHKPAEGVLPCSWWDKNTYAAREYGTATLRVFLANRLVSHSPSRPLQFKTASG